MTRRVLFAAVLAASLALTGCTNFAHNEEQRDVLGTPFEVELDESKATVSIAANEMHEITTAEFDAWGLASWERWYGSDFTGMRLYYAGFSVESAGDANTVIEARELGWGNWRLTTSEGRDIQAYFAWGQEVPCGDFTDEQAAAVADGRTEDACVFFIVPEDQEVTELHFAGVDTGRTRVGETRSLEAFVTWTID